MPVLLAVIILALVSGCARKKPVLVMPQQPPPATAPTPEPTPAEAQTQTPAAQSEATPQPSPSPEPATPAPEQATTGKTHAKRHVKKPSPQVPSGDKNEIARKTVVENAPAPQPAPTAPSPEVTQEQAANEQLLKNTEEAINGIKRQLSRDEQTMLAQIRDFITQSRKAAEQKDFTSAHNLALKAHVLSNELVRQR
jgi:hypothetical protein